MSDLTDTIARAAVAVLELDAGIHEVEVKFVDEETRCHVHAFRCSVPGCPNTHVELQTSRGWDRDAADERLYHGQPPDV